MARKSIRANIGNTESLRAIFDQHEKLLRDLNTEFTNRLEEADQRFKYTLHELEQTLSTPEPQPEPEPKKEESNKDIPAAVWMVVDDEHMLVLNQAAAVQQLALLEKLAEVLDELSKLAPKKAR